MSDSTLTAIKMKVRRLTGSPNISQLSENDLEEYINTFYLFDLPAYMKVWNLHENYTFFTEPNEDSYTFPINPTFDANGNQLQSFQGINPPVYIDGYQSFYSQSQEQFYRIYPRINFEQVGPSGNASVVTAYSLTFTNIPVLRRQVTISATDSSGISRVVQDDGDGNLVNADPTIANPVNTGNINYVTGAITNLFFRDSNDAVVAIPTTESLTSRYVPYVASRPVGMLFYDDQMILRPVPDKVYRVEMEVFKTPIQFISDSQDPEVHQWWQLIAFGAARKVLQDRLDNDSLASVEPFFQEQMELAMNRTALQLAPQRVSTIYTDMLNYPVGNRPFGGL